MLSLILCVIFHLLFTQSQTALNEYIKNPDLSYIGLFSLKLFYGLLIGLIVFFVGKLSSILLKDAFKLLEKGRDLNALSVLSSKIIKSSSTDLENLTEAQIFDKKIDLKVQLFSNSIYKKEFEDVKQSTLNTNLEK